MTAFSRQDSKLNDIELCWEIRTVNHRHLDISLHIPESLQHSENALKEIIRHKLGRGRVDLTLTVQPVAMAKQEKISINTHKAKALLDACETLKILSPESKAPSQIEVLQWQGVIEETEDKAKDYSKHAKSLLSEALDELIKMREAEGGRLLEMIQIRCKSILQLVESVKSRRVYVLENLREKVIKKIAELEIPADNNRLEQELVYQAQRLDVDEELDRLGAHIEEVNAVLKRDEPIGRRLDFLMQELNREANTLASKSNDTETTRSAVELKILIEQMREQCLNIE